MKDLSQRTMARLAILAWISLLLMAVAAGFSYWYVFTKLIVPWNILDTASNIQNNIILFRISVLSFLVVLILDVIVSWCLYLFLKPVDKHISAITAIFRLIYSSILWVSILNLVTIIELAKTWFSYQSLMYINIFNLEWSVWLIIFWLHLILLAYLILKSLSVPKIIWILLLVGWICYVLTNTTNLIWPDYIFYKSTVDSILWLPMALWELSLAFWLLIFGFKKPIEND